MATTLRTQKAFELTAFLGEQPYRRRPLQRAEQLLAAAPIGPTTKRRVFGQLVTEVAAELAALKRRMNGSMRRSATFLTLPRGSSYPIHFEEYAVVADSDGAGKYHGALASSATRPEKKSCRPWAQPKSRPEAN